MKNLMRERFSEIARLDDEQINLDEAALLIAAESDPQIDIPSYLKTLDKLATNSSTAITEPSLARLI